MKLTVQILAYITIALTFVNVIYPFCSTSPAELDAARRENIRLEGARVGQDNYTLFQEISREILNTSTITYYLEAVGVFPPADAIDYVGLLVPNPPLFPTPNRQYQTKDFTLVEEIAPNLYYVPAKILTYNLYDDNLGDYVYKIDGIRMIQYIQFDECSSKINTVLTKSDRTYADFQVEVLSPTVPVELVCQVGFGVCAQAGLLAEAGFYSQEECEDQYNSLPPVSPCPSALSSDTLICRAIHAFSATLNATVHCPHLQFTSPVCYDRCLPDCAGCDENAHCLEIFNESAVIARDFPNFLSYECACNDGYVGNGTHCELQSCDYIWQCEVEDEKQTSGAPYHVCKENVCACNDTLSWNPTKGNCVCRDDQFLTWDNHIPICLDKGKCLQRSDCEQDYSEVQCKQFDYPNHLSPGDFCLCNPGFDNYGFNNPDCYCNNGTKVWSSLQNGRVCIHDGECIGDYNCNNGEHCHIPTGNVIGTCH